MITASCVALLLVLGSAQSAQTKTDAAATARLHQLLWDRGTTRSEAELLAELDKAVQAGADVNAKNDAGLVPLVMACDRRSPAVVAWLVEHGAAVNTAQVAALTPLMIAAQRLPLETVQLLVEKGADVRARSQEGSDFTAFDLALRSHRYPVALYLLEHGGYVGKEQRIFLYAQLGHVPGVVKEWKRGSQKAKNQNGDTLLHLAAWHGQLRMVEELLKRKAAVNTFDGEGHSPLWLAVASEQNLPDKPALLELLLKNGADLEQVFEHKRTLLHVAARTGAARLDREHFIQTIRVLLDRGLSAAAKDDEGYMPANAAAKALNFDAARVLLDATPAITADELGLLAIDSLENESFLKHLVEVRHANLNVKGRLGNTILHQVAAKQSVSLARYLLAHGADPTIKNDFGDTWLEATFTTDEFRHEMRKQSGKNQ